METHTSRDEAVSALGEVVRTQRAAARRLRTPWWFWYFVAVFQVGVFVALFVASELAGSWASVTVFVVALLLEAKLAHRYPALRFNWNRRAKRIGIISIVASIAVLGVGIIGFRSVGGWWPIAMALLLVAVLTVWLGRLSERGIDAPAHPAA